MAVNGIKACCPECKANMTVPDQYIGKGIKCPRCKSGFRLKRSISQNGISVEKSSNGNMPKYNGFNNDTLDAPPRFSTKENQQSGLFSAVKDYFMFRTFILPAIVIIFFILAVIVFGISIVNEITPQPEPANIFSPDYEPPGSLMPSWFMRFFVPFLILLWVRVILESVIIIFRIYTKLCEMAKSKLPA